MIAYPIVPVRGRVATEYMGIAFLLLGLKNVEPLQNQRMEALVAAICENLGMPNKPPTVPAFHSAENRIVSISQPWIRPIVRGKTKAPVEFGAKFDLSIDDSGLGRIEKISYDAYNESTVLVEAVERFRERTGHYPERLLADQIYRTRDNRNFCKLHGIRLSGPKLGRPSLTKQSAKEKKQEYQDNTDRIEVERSFSLSKRCYGMDLHKNQDLDDTTANIDCVICICDEFV